MRKEMIQLDLFESCEMTLLKWELERLSLKKEKTRKALHAKRKDLEKKMEMLEMTLKGEKL